MKTFNFFIFLILFSTVFVSCGEKKTSPENNSMQQDTVGSKELAHIDYVCPMDCEKGKVYHEMGKCPKCKMDLIKKEHEDHDGHDHHEGHPGQRQPVSDDAVRPVERPRPVRPRATQPRYR